MQGNQHPGYQNQQSTEQGAHDDRVVQRMADSHISIIGHHSQENVIQFCKENVKIHLGDAAFIGDTAALCLDVPQHLWDGGGGDTDVYKRQVGEEEVHGCVEVGIWADSQDNK